MPPIPRDIHQSWPSKDHLKWSAQPQVWRTSWTTQAAWGYHLYNDADCQAFIENSFPKLVDVYQALPTGAERADLFRYCMLHEQGGLWADLDTTCMEPLTTWPLSDCELLTGVQGVVPAGLPPPPGFVRAVQLCQWIIAAAPKHPVLAAVIQEVETRVRAALKKDKTLPITAEAIFNRTGAGVWTDCVLQSLKLPDGKTRWDDVLAEPFDQNSVRIVPMRALAWDKGVRHLPKSATWDRILARHHAMGSWKPKPAT